MRKKVTIVIPTYNGSKYVGKTIESCIHQTYEDLSIIVINDNSTDNTLEVVKKYKDSVNIVHNETNLGLPRNINNAILEDDSAFFIYLGHDDLLPPRHIEIMLAEFEEDTVAVHCNSMAINSAGKELAYTKINHAQVRKTRDLMYQLSIDNFISIVGMMHRTESFKKVRGWDASYDLFGEWLYYIRVASIGKIKYTDKSFAFYRIHETNISKSLHDKNKLKPHYEYRRRCRLLAHKYSKGSGFWQSFDFHKQNVLSYLRYLKAVLISLFV